jgi:hypothetical protein
VALLDTDVAMQAGTNEIEAKHEGETQWICVRGFLSRSIKLNII